MLVCGRVWVEWDFFPKSGRGGRGVGGWGGGLGWGFGEGEEQEKGRTCH